MGTKSAKGVEKVEELRAALIRELCVGSLSEESDAALFARLACEDAAVHMVALGNAFERKTKANQEAAMAHIKRLGDEAIEEARLEGTRLCHLLGLGPDSGPKARKRAQEIVKAEGAAIMEAASARIDAAVAANKVEDDLAKARLRLRLSMVEEALRRSLNARSLTREANLAQKDAKNLIDTWLGKAVPDQ